jgi:uncharacterized protein YjiS (DUF1127 family)
MRRLISFISPALLPPPGGSAAVESRPRVHPEVEAWAIRAAASSGFGGEIPSTAADGGNRHATPLVVVADPEQSAGGRARRYARRVKALYRLFRRQARHRAALRQLQSLDAALLRDIGLTRSEIGSAHAEAVGLVAPTRRIFVEHEWLRIRSGASGRPGAGF